MQAAPPSFTLAYDACASLNEKEADGSGWSDEDDDLAANGATSPTPDGAALMVAAQSALALLLVGLV